ncbi:hypothetical protein EJB05_33433, partial [Eragrostis curvula]
MVVAFFLQCTEAWLCGRTAQCHLPAALEPSSSTGRSATEARALKIHSEAERRRRERINAHLATLRRMIPDTKQMDKATLLANVVNQLNDLKRKASESTQPLPVPAEANSITVDCYTGDERTVYIQASISCDDRPGLLADLAAAFRGLSLRALRADMASLGGRTRCSFVLCKEDGDLKKLMSEGSMALEEAVRQALAMAAFSEMVHGCSGSRSKRQRVLESRFLLGSELMNSMLLDVLDENRRNEQNETVQ